MKPSGPSDGTILVMTLAGALAAAALPVLDALHRLPRWSGPLIIAVALANAAILITRRFRNRTAE